MALTAARGKEIVVFGATVDIIFRPNAPPNQKAIRLRRPLSHLPDPVRRFPRLPWRMHLGNGNPRNNRLSPP